MEASERPTAIDYKVKIQKHLEKLNSRVPSYQRGSCRGIPEHKVDSFADCTTQSSDDEETPSKTSVNIQGSSDIQIGPRTNFMASVSSAEHVERNKSPVTVVAERCNGIQIGARVTYNAPITINHTVQVFSSPDAVETQKQRMTVTENLAGEELQSPEQVKVFNKLSPGSDCIPSGKLLIIPRRFWLAQPPMEPPQLLRHPVQYVVILHTATEMVTTRAACVHLVRHIQMFHVEGNGWSDISYSFLIGGDGNVYEGRGWENMGAFAYGYNEFAVGIAVIGTFIKDLPNAVQLHACRQLIQQGVSEGKISADYKLLAHRQLCSTESPGEAFYQLIKTWPHWVERPDDKHTVFKS